MAKKAAKSTKSNRGMTRGARPLLSYRVQHPIDLELCYDSGRLDLSTILSHDPDEDEKLRNEYLCVDAVATVNATEWVLSGRTDYHGSGKPIEIIIPQELILSMRIDNLD